ncbi:MAG: CoA transferase subunit A [Streptomycetaceae bacterium]|nr:CoA transferase subunit A [Streptomycetaceae bacterium]
MTDKTLTIDQVLAHLHDGMTLGIGGMGARRKPMALVRAIAASPLRDLTVVSFGGPDVGLLAATGKLRRVVTGSVSLDHATVDPHFVRARDAGRVEVCEWDHAVLRAGLTAAAQRLPFMPTRAGIASDAGGSDRRLRTVASPYADAEELLAVPALHLDAALVHLNRGDHHGNGQYLGPDPYFDDLFCMAARQRFMSVERIVGTDELTEHAAPQTLLLNRSMVDGVVATPGGAHFTSCVPDYGRDRRFLDHYAHAAADPEAWDGFCSRFLSRDEEAYQLAVLAWRADPSADVPADTACTGGPQ